MVSPDREEGPMHDLTPMDSANPSSNEIQSTDFEDNAEIGRLCALYVLQAFIILIYVLAYVFLVPPGPSISVHDLTPMDSTNPSSDEIQSTDFEDNAEIGRLCALYYMHRPLCDF